MAEVIRVGIVSSTRAVRAGLRVLLNESNIRIQLPDNLTREIQILDEAAGLAEYINHPIELDIFLITEDALEPGILERLALDNAGYLAVLILGSDPRPIKVLADLPLRSWGFLLSDSTPEELVAALFTLHQGLLVIAPPLIKITFDPIRLSQGRFVVNTNFEDDEIIILKLTERENDVLQLLAQGLANKQIANHLGISEHTVKFHVSSIYTKFGVTNRTEAVRCGIQQGLVLL